MNIDILRVNNLSYSIDQERILTDISFNVEKGEVFGVIGPNGSGKTTLLRLLSGLVPFNNGSIYYEGKSIKDYHKKDLARSIAYMEQEGTPLIPFTVEEVVSMGRYPWLKAFSDLKNEDKRIIKEILTTLNLLDKSNQSVDTLSGGQRQLVSLARAMAQAPKLIFLDEPTTYLDIAHQKQVMQYVRKWQKEKGLTVIMVIHDLNLAAQYTDRLMLLKNGSVQAIGSVADVLKPSIIEKVYETKPLVIEHPTSGVPQILLT